MHIWTDTPLREMWHQLRYLRSPANVENLLVGRISSGRPKIWPQAEEVRRHAYEIACCIEQGDQYFHASEGVGLATKPLLQFYGAQALAKAAILANDLQVNLGNLKYHGLSTRPSTADGSCRDALQDYSDNPDHWEIEAEFGVTNDGVLPHLARVAADNIPGRGQVLRFKEILRIIPDLSDLYTRHYGEPSHCFYLYGKPEIKSDGHFSVFFRSRTELTAVRQVFLEFGSEYEDSLCDRQPGLQSQKLMQELPKFAVVVKGAVAGEYYVRPHPSGIYKPLTVLYAGQFILSNVVRYKPAFWMSVLDGTKTGAASVIEAFCNIFERRFPNETLETIWHETFTYSGPAYLS
jgi:hypothetical protein